MKSRAIVVVAGFLCCTNASAMSTPTAPTNVCVSKPDRRLEVCKILVLTRMDEGASCGVYVDPNDAYIKISDDEADADDVSLKRVKLVWKIVSDRPARHEYRFTNRYGVDIYENSVPQNQDFIKKNNDLNDDVSRWVVKRKGVVTKHDYVFNVEGRVKPNGRWITCGQIDPVIAND